ncbi:MAG: tRNA pseudouridine(38-40) synthase TruA [Bacteroidales bacterium]|nr:tRNA pseudouridine(38-40) synthase TruA [Bacteroidales bacterium]
MQRYFIELQYDGSNYHGWQIQPNAPTVQQELNEKLSVLLNKKIETIGAGRTDTGVHARHFVAHFDLNKPIHTDIQKFIHKLNCFLAEDIKVNNIIPVDSKAHARFDAVSRTYSYYIATGKTVFNKNYVWQIYQPLNLSKMNLGAKKLMEYHDFTSFSKLHSDVKSYICDIYSSKWKFENDLMVYNITANRFLRNMVRAIVGTLVLLGRNKIDIEQFCKIIESKDRSLAGESAPANALFLEHIQYS